MAALIMDEAVKSQTQGFGGRPGRIWHLQVENCPLKKWQTRNLLQLLDSCSESGLWPWFPTEIYKGKSQLIKLCKSDHLSLEQAFVGRHWNLDQAFTPSTCQSSSALLSHCQKPMRSNSHLFNWGFLWEYWIANVSLVCNITYAVYWQKALCNMKA